MMNNPNPQSFEMTSFLEASKQVDAFENLLIQNGISIKNGSQLEHGCLILKELLSEYERTLLGETLTSTFEFRDDIQIAVGVMNIIQLCLVNRDHEDFGALLPHLSILSDGAMVQTKPAEFSDQISNKIFELRFALACMKTGSELKMDDPIHSSKGENPDILCKMTDGRTWGFACKVVHGDAPMSLFENLLKGVQQIERSSADTGMVVISLKNKLPHDEIFPVYKDILGNPFYAAQEHWGAVATKLSNRFESTIQRMIDHVGPVEVFNLFQNKKAIPSINSPLETIAVIKTIRGRMPTYCGYLHSSKLETESRQFDDRALQVLKDINSGLAVNRPLEK